MLGNKVFLSKNIPLLQTSSLKQCEFYGVLCPCIYFLGVRRFPNEGSNLLNGGEKMEIYGSRGDHLLLISLVRR